MVFLLALCTTISAAHVLRSLPGPDQTFLETSSRSRSTATVSVQARTRIVGIMNIVDLLVGTGLSAAAWTLDKTTHNQERQKIEATSGTNDLTMAVESTQNMLKDMQDWLEKLDFQVATKAQVAWDSLLEARPDIEKESDGPMLRLKRHLDVLLKKGYAQIKETDKKLVDGTTENHNEDEEDTGVLETQALDRAWNEQLKDLVLALPDKFQHTRDRIVKWFQHLRSPAARDALFGSIVKGQVTYQTIRVVVAQLVKSLVPLLNTVVGVYTLSRSVSRYLSQSGRCDNYIHRLHLENAVAKKDLLYQTCLSLSNLIEGVGHPKTGLLHHHRLLKSGCHSCNENFDMAMDSIEDAFGRFLKESTDSTFGTGGVCEGYLALRNPHHVYSKMDHHHTTCPVLQIRSDMTPNTRKVLVAEDSAWTITAGEGHHSYLLPGADLVAGPDHFLWRSLRYYSRASSKVLDVGRSCDHHRGEFKMAPITALGVLYSGDVELNQHDLEQDVNGNNDQDVRLLRKYQPVWEYTAAAVVRDKVVHAEGLQKMRLCQKEECVDYQGGGGGGGGGGGRQMARLIKLSGATLYKQYGTFVLSRGFGAPIVQVGLCSRGGGHESKKEGEDGWYTFTPLLAMNMQGSCPSQGKLNMWTYHEDKRLCYQKNWHSIHLNCPECFDD